MSVERTILETVADAPGVFELVPLTWTTLALSSSNTSVGKPKVVVAHAYVKSDALIFV